MIINRGKWEELPAQCKQCENMRVMSLYMDGNHYYSCGKYPLTDADRSCPRFVQKTEDANV